MSDHTHHEAETMTTDRMFWVALYLMDRHYGGPEEGGWWFDEGTLVTDRACYEQLGGAPAAFLTAQSATAFATRLERFLPLLNEGCRPLGSVLSNGIYEVLVINAERLPNTCPEERPHYE